MSEPPSFTPYSAEFSLSSSSNIISHDPHLNEDGEALYRFLLQQALIPPSLKLHCSGTHTETHTRWVTVERNGTCESRQETYTEHITDFDIHIDLAHLFLSLNDTDLPNTQHPREIEPILFSVPDFEPAYRGSMVKQVLVPSADSDPESQTSSKTRQPTPRLTPTSPPHSSPLCPHVNGQTPTAPPPKLLKQFTFHKIPYGFNTQLLTQHIHTLIASTPYSGKITVEWQIQGDKVYVRPDNWLSRMLSKVWFKVLLWLCLLYPFVWLFKRFHRLGGGRWEVCGGAYALKRWVPVEQSVPSLQFEDTKLPPYPPPPSSPIPQPNGPSPSSSALSTSYAFPTSRTLTTPSGTLKLLGTQESEWLRDWAPTIARAVLTRYQSSIPLTVPDAASRFDLTFPFPFSIPTPSAMSASDGLLPSISSVSLRYHLLTQAPSPSSLNLTAPPIPYHARTSTLPALWQPLLPSPTSSSQVTMLVFVAIMRSTTTPRKSRPSLDIP
ncbi:hypothetical protein ONZ45_g858 [Pleurotus djamor]|nr:hypothetical protein ONZ45_g858 [Pleurotus djamor]